jgi:lipopolysaccharide transport system ATP-binding protein
MSDVALEMDHVFKKFKKGELYDSLRDLLPAMACRIFKRAEDEDLSTNEFWALRDISFQVNSGEAFGIIGPNGAGKSTILKLLTRIMEPTKGNMRVHGTVAALIEVGAGFHPDLTGRENIFLNGTILGMSREQIKKKFDEIVEFSGLTDFIDTPVKRYSSGMYARLGFSVAAHVDANVLVVDEVLSVGDYLFQKKCIDKMRSVFGTGATLIFVSHHLKSVSDLCQRTLLLEKGKASMVGPTKEVVRYYLNRYVENHAGESEKEVYISNVGIRNAKGECYNFESGEKAFIDIQVGSNARCENLSISIYIQDDNDYNIFDTSTARLDNRTFSPNINESLECTFEMDLHLTQGKYHLGVLIYQYNIQKAYDRWFPAQTIFIHSERDVRGGANLYPKLITFQFCSQNQE